MQESSSVEREKREIYFSIFQIFLQKNLYFEKTKTGEKDEKCLHSHGGRD